MYFVPRFEDGTFVLLPWQLRLFFLNANWPMGDFATKSQHFCNKLSLTVTFISLSTLTESMFYFVIVNRENLKLVLEALPAVFVGLEIILRVFHMAYKRDEFKVMIREFYAKIYFERSNGNEVFYDDIQRMSRLTRINVYSYLGSLLTVYATTIFSLFSKQRVLPFLMQPHYDYHPWVAFLPTTISAIWGVTIVLTQQAAEATLLVSLMLNLNGRYLQLQRDLSELYEKSKRGKIIETESKFIVSNFYNGLGKILNRNYKLNKFASLVQEQYSLRIFVMLGLSTVVLCVSGFKAATTLTQSDVVTFVLWLGTKSLELFIFGNVGSTLIQTTDQMSNAYYASNWEQVLQHSGNAQQNKKIMKVVTIAMNLNQNPIYLSGFGFFNISLPTIVTIFKGAGSYFTSLYALR